MFVYTYKCAHLYIYYNAVTGNFLNLAEVSYYYLYFDNV